VPRQCALCASPLWLCHVCHVVWLLSRAILNPLQICFIKGSLNIFLRNFRHRLLRKIRVGTPPAHRIVDDFPIPESLRESTCGQECSLRDLTGSEECSLVLTFCICTS
jgi:hypothetical protein